MEIFKTAAKAVYAAVWVAISTLTVTLTGDQNLSDLTTLQWLLVALAVLGAFGGVYRLKNTPPDQS